MLDILTQLGIAIVVALVVTVFVNAALAALARRNIDPVGGIARMLSPTDERESAAATDAAVEA